MRVRFQSPEISPIESYKSPTNSSKVIQSKTDMQNFTPRDSGTARMTSDKWLENDLLKNLYA